MTRTPETIHRLRPLLGTFVAIEATGHAPVEPALTAAFAAIQRTATLMRPLTPGSDVQRISAASRGATLRIDAWTHAVLELAHRLHRDSGGVFDPCRPAQPGRLADLELLAPDAVRCHAPVALDLGGIAKGFAVDRAVDTLQRLGCSSGLVNAGGDVRCFGPTTQRIVVTDDASADRSLRVALDNNALAVSAPRSSRSPAEHVGYYDGSTAAIVPGRWAAVIAAESATADALCKCVMLGPRHVAARLLAAYAARCIEVAS